MKITPDQYRAALKVVKDYRDQLRAALDQVVIEVRDAEVNNVPQKHSTLFELLSNKECSLRLHNVIHHNQEASGITTLHRNKAKVQVGALEGVSARKLLSCRHAGVA